MQIKQRKPRGKFLREIKLMREPIFGDLVEIIMMRSATTALNFTPNVSSFLFSQSSSGYKTESPKMIYKDTSKEGLAKEE